MLTIPPNSPATTTTRRSALASFGAKAFARALNRFVSAPAPTGDKQRTRPVQPSRERSVLHICVKSSAMRRTALRWGGGSSSMNAPATAASAQIAASTRAVVDVDRFVIIHVMSAPPTAVPARFPAVCQPDAAPRLASGTVSAMRESTAEPLVATAACATKSAAV